MKDGFGVLQIMYKRIKRLHEYNCPLLGRSCENDKKQEKEVGTHTDKEIIVYK